MAAYRRGARRASVAAAAKPPKDPGDRVPETAPKYNDGTKNGRYRGGNWRDQVRSDVGQ